MSGNLSITWNNLKTCYGYAKKIANVTPELVLGTASESLGEALRTTKGSIFKKAEAGWNKLYAEGKGKFFKDKFIPSLRDFVPSIKSSIKEYKGIAKAAGKSEFLGGAKGLFKGLGKKMPLIASLSMILFELPNIFTATKEKGIFQGGAEVVKATARLTGASIGAAIGTAAIPIPFLGSMIGWVAGEWLTGKIVGKSYSEQKAEKEEELQKQQEQLVADNSEQQQYANSFWMQNAQGNQNTSQAEIPQTQPQIPQPAFNQYQPQFNPSMQGINPQFTGLYNPFNNPYTSTNNFMMPQMQFNNLA